MRGLRTCPLADAGPQVSWIRGLTADLWCTNTCGSGVWTEAGPNLWVLFSHNC